MKMKRAAIGLALMGVLVTGVRLDAEKSKPSLEAIAHEVNRSWQSDDQIVGVMWYPEAVWRLFCRADDPLANKLASYNIVAVFAMAVDSDGVPKPVPEATLRKTIRVKDSRGRSYSPSVSGPVRDEEIKNFFELSKGMLGKKLAEEPKGPLFLKNLHYFFFPAADPTGNVFADPTNSGFFSLKVLDANFRWELPLKCFSGPAAAGGEESD